MGKNLKILAVVLGILMGTCLLGMLGLFLGYIMKPQPTLAESVNERWNLDLPIPQDAVAEYQNSELGLGGDGRRYCVFIFEEEPTQFLANFHENKNEAFEKEFTDLVENMEKFADIPSNMFPSFEEEYAWKYKWQTEQGNAGYDFPATASAEHEFVEYLLMVYFPKNRQLYTCEFLW